jgi:signal peptidase II
VYQVQGARGAAAQRPSLDRQPGRRPAARASRRPASWGLALAAFAFAFGSAVAADAAATAHLNPGVELVVVPRILSLTLLHNTGVAFSLFRSAPPFLIVVLALTVLAVALYNRNAWPRTGLVRCGLGLVVGGAAANVTERLRFGYVIDYLDVHVWPVFNLADSAVVVGAGLLVWALWRMGGSGARPDGNGGDR